jgi:hypothetical protein
MKWFGTPIDESDDIATAEQCIKYLRSKGDRPEKWSALRTLIKLITEQKLPDETLGEAIKIRWRTVYMRISTKASTEVLEMLLDEDIQDDNLYANMVYNKNLTPIQASEILNRLGDTPRASAVRRKIQSILDNL